MNKLEQFQHRAVKMTAGQEHLKSGSETWDCLGWRTEGSGKPYQCVSIPDDSKTKSDSSQRYTVKGHKVMAINSNRNFHSKTILVLHLGWSHTGTGCPERNHGVSICGDTQNETEHRTEQPAVGDPVFSRGIRLDNVQWFYPKSSVILWHMFWQLRWK